MRSTLPRTALAVFVILAPLSPALGEAAPTDEDRVALAMAYLAAGQGEDGGFSLPNQAYVLEAAASAGLPPHAWPRRDASALDAQRVVEPEGCVGASDPDDCAYYAALRLAHALGGAGYDPRDFRGVDLVERIRTGFLALQFGNATFVNDDIWGILALRAAGVPASDPQIQAAADNVQRAQLPDGGWAFAVTSTLSSTDVTGAALAALKAAGKDTGSNVAAKAFLASMHDDGDNGTGGYRGSRVQGPNCASTVWGVHGARAVGMPEPPAAVAYLRAQQREDGGIAQSTGGASDAFCTAEAVIVLTGDRYPLRAFAPGKVVLPALRRAEPATLRVDGPFATATWSLPDGERVGLRVAWTPPAAGAHPYDLVAEGALTRFRAGGTFDVASARPHVELPTDVEALRHVPVVLEPTAWDPDGQVVAFEVDWGDGTVGRALHHAYATPGDRVVSLRARDDSGEWSPAARTIVHVRNRAPVLDGLPVTVTADRAHDVDLFARASDADGDEVTVSWTWEHGRTEGPHLQRRFATLGNHSLAVAALDAYGAETKARVTVAVVNLPPVLTDVTLPASARAGEPFPFAVVASDPDGTTPLVRWTLGVHEHEGSSGEATLAAGEHDVRVVARDADGGVREARATLRVVDADAAGDPTPTTAVIEPPPKENALAPAEAPPFPTPTFLHPPRNATVGDRIAFSLAPMDEATEYLFEMGDGNATGWVEDVVAAHAWGRPGAFEVRAHARASDGRTAMASWVVHVRPAASASSESTEGPSAKGGVAPLVDETPAIPLEASARITPEEERGTPAGWGVVPLALLLAALGRRARRA